MSKTVKRVTRVMMVGLIAMLGAKAEAHYIVVGGKPKVCSVCVDVKLTDVDVEDTVNPAPAEVELVATTNPLPAEVELVATTKKVEILCKNGDVVPAEPMTLFSRKPIAPGDITKVKGDSTARAEVRVIVSDVPFLENLKLCPDLSPVAMLIRVISSVEINTYACDPNDPTCSKLKLASTWQVTNCKLPARFDFQNDPPFGTPYKCDPPAISHKF